MSQTKILISSDEEGNAGRAIHDNAKDEAASWYTEGGFCEVSLYAVPESKLKPDWETYSHRTSFLKDEDEDIEDYLIDSCDYVEPPEPKCAEANKHSWEQIGLNGDGGGIVRTDECSHCHLRRVTNTCDQNPATGVQGYETVEYDDTIIARAQ